MERSVRKYGTRKGTPIRCCADHDLLDLLVALLQHAFGNQDYDHTPGGAVLGGGRTLVPLFSRLQHEHRGVGWAVCAYGCRRRNRDVHAAVPGHCLSRSSSEGIDEE